MLKLENFLLDSDNEEENDLDIKLIKYFDQINYKT